MDHVDPNWSIPERRDDDLAAHVRTYRNFVYALRVIIIVSALSLLLMAYVLR